MTGNSEAAVLNRIAARAAEVNFDRIGRATAREADDLKDIVGVGPFLERKLHTLGIYTFRQIANFTKEDIDKVNELIEFFPGRIERDNWVEQSKEFYKRKSAKHLRQVSHRLKRKGIIRTRSINLLVILGCHAVCPKIGIHIVHTA